MFCWIRPLNCGLENRQNYTVGFQSLFCWIRPLNLRQCPAHRTGNPVSILVLLDSAPQLVGADQSPPPSYQFQSLFCWIRPLNCNVVGVSRYIAIRSFNPCSVGFGPSTSGGKRTMSLLISGFNPCSVGFGPSTLNARASTFARCSSFNPCSVGFGPSTTAAHMIPAILTGFNPCSVGFGPSTAGAEAEERTHLEFQSLFCWIRPLNRSWPRPPGDDPPGFNPCSVGFGPSTPSQTDQGELVHPVSILVLLDSAPQQGRRQGLSRSLDAVSILVLLDSAPQHQQSAWNAGMSGKFQSLFCWIRPLNRDTTTPTARQRSVSILVLLDSAPQLTLDLTNDYLTWEFQSLFCWIRPLNP